MPVSERSSEWEIRYGWDAERLANDGHPDFPHGSTVRHIGYAVRGTVSLSRPDRVMVEWNTGLVETFDGWQARNALRNAS